MKVLFLANIPSPYRVDFFNELGKYCELTVLFEKEKADNREWKTLECTNFNCVFLRGIKISSDTSLCFNVIEYLKKDYDFIIIGGYSTPTGMLAIEYLRHKRKKFILSADGGIIKSEKRSVFFIKRHFIKSASWWLSTGQITTEYFIHYGANKGRIYTYPFSSVRNYQVNSEIVTGYKKTILKEKFGMNTDKAIVSVGQFIYRKGFDILLKAASDLPENISLYIIGGQPTKEYLEILKNMNYKNIYFKPFMQNKDLFDFFSVCDLFVLPTREDIWGLVVNEALACGLPVVTTDKCVAGVELIENDINGMIIQSENIDELRSSIKKMLNRSIDKGQIKKTVKKYTIEEMAKEHIRILKKIKEQLE